MCFVIALVKTIRVAYIFWSVSPSKKVYYNVIKTIINTLVFNIIMVVLLI